MVFGMSTNAPALEAHAREFHRIALAMLDELGHAPDMPTDNPTPAAPTSAATLATDALLDLVVACRQLDDAIAHVAKLSPGPRTGRALASARTAVDTARHWIGEARELVDVEAPRTGDVPGEPLAGSPFDPNTVPAWAGGPHDRATGKPST